jgi:hypothetical protein
MGVLMLDFLGRLNGGQVLPAEKHSGAGREGTCQVEHALSRFLRPRTKPAGAVIEIFDCKTFSD